MYWFGCGRPVVRTLSLLTVWVSDASPISWSEGLGSASMGFETSWLTTYRSWEGAHRRWDFVETWLYDLYVDWLNHNPSWSRLRIYSLIADSLNKEEENIWDGYAAWWFWLLRREYVAREGKERSIRTIFLGALRVSIVSNTLPQSLEASLCLSW